MAAHRWWRIRVNSVVSQDYVQITRVSLFDVVGGANLATHPATGTGSSSSTNNGSATWCWGAGDGWTSSIGAAFPQWTQFDFGAGVTKDVVRATVTNGIFAPECAQSITILVSDDGVLWQHVDDFTNSGVANASTSFDFVGPSWRANAALVAPSVASALSGYGGASAGLASPSAGVAGYSGSSLVAAAPAAKLGGFGGAKASLAGASPTFYAAGRSSAGDNDFTYTSPPPSLSANGGANGKLTAPAQTLVVTATVTGWGRASLAAPAATLFAAGTVSGTASTALSVPTASLIGYSGAVCSVTLTGGATMQASGTAGGIGRAVMSCPLFELTASASAQDYGSADLLAPAPRIGATAQAWLAAPGAKLTAIGTAVVAVEYEAYAVNLRSELEGGGNEVTRYTNFPFDRIVRWRGSYYGMAADGLYLLEGNTDDGAPIEWALRTGTTDFDKPEKKNTASAYVGGRLGPATTFTVFTGEKSENQYAYTTPRGATAQNYRQKFGRGLDARYYAFRMEGDGELEMDDLTIEVVPRTRRI